MLNLDAPNLGHFYNIAPISTPNPKSIIALTISNKVMCPRDSFDIV
ncbi:hypothetical protein PPRY_a0572 [Pseudoalteromonas prydzensis ACAM 620]|nr:hypothetical protein [Pseudoalteromonas prydzensis ACAM 620]